ncbi:MAG TPA: hypothetical protein VFX37_03545 [Pseudolabrys sp.]|nr:hypothetical protein [Pseudolabrys sp.]
MRISTRSLAAALAGTLALTMANLTPAEAAAKHPQVKQPTTTTISARHHWHHGNAAVLGAVAGVFGTIAGIAAADAARDDYYGYDYPYYGPYYGGYAYAPRYRYHHWHHHWHHWHHR